MRKNKGPLIVDKAEEEDTWFVHPTPGICIKFKNVQYPSSSISAATKSGKFFINLVHCIELPPPKEWLDEDAVANLSETNPDAYLIPICIGQLVETADHSGEPVNKIDVLVNSEFYRKCIDESEFFRQLTIRIACETIKDKYGFQIDNSTQVILRNRKYIGEIEPQRIRKRQLNSVLDKNAKKIALENDADKDEQLLDIDDIEDAQPRRPRNFKVQIKKGETMEIKVKVKDNQGELVREGDRISLKMNNDRIVLLLDASLTIADFFLPFTIKEEMADCTFDTQHSILSIICPLDWN